MAEQTDLMAAYVKEQKQDPALGVDEAEMYGPVIDWLCLAVNSILCRSITRACCNICSSAMPNITCTSLR